MNQAKIEPVPLFPTLVWKIEFPDELTQRINQSVLPLIRSKLQSDLETSPKILQQTEQNLHLTPEFEELVKNVYLHANHALEYLSIDYDAIQITGCWANISGVGHSHRRHSHPNNFLSGVYYIEVPVGGNNIVFHDPRPQIPIIKPPVKKMTFENADHAVAQVKPGTMLLFPSWLNHSVPTSKGTDRKISVAFNLMFLQYAETMSNPMWKGNLE